MKIKTRTVACAILLASVPLFIGGCAGRNASRASFDENRTLSLGQLESKTEEMVADMVSNPQFVAFKKTAQGSAKEPVDVIILLQNVDGSATNDKEWPKMMESLFSYLEGSLANQSLSFRQDLDPGLPNYVKGIEEFDKQDSDARYLQTTGTVTTGGAHKAVLGLVLTATKQQIGNNVEIELRAKVVNGESKTTLFIARSRTTNPASERR
jgi:hypothetical protein